MELTVSNFHISILGFFAHLSPIWVLSLAGPGAYIAILGDFLNWGVSILPVVDVCTMMVLGGARKCSLSRISIRSSLSTTQKMFIHYYF